MYIVRGFYTLWREYLWSLSRFRDIFGFTSLCTARYIYIGDYKQIYANYNQQDAA
jgi:hypothetical protein